MDDGLDILLVEDRPGDAALLRESLSGESRVRLFGAERLADGIALARQRHFDVMLLDLTLPDTSGADTILRAAAALPDMPIVVMTGTSDEEAASLAVRHGAQDYLVKGAADRMTILRSVRYAIERKRAAVSLQKAHGELEEKVRQRTSELAATVARLQAEVRQREATEREVLEAAEREQNRIGRDLHDSIQGSLAGISMMLACLKRRAENAAAELVQEIDKIEGLISQTLQQTRGLARSLCPVDLAGDGLMRALEILANTTSSLFRVPCEFHCRRKVLVPDKTVALHLYYIAHEAVNNALKHARAKCIRLVLDRGEQGLVLTVQDDGTGIRPERPGGGMGLRTMAYRAGAIGAALSIDPDPDGGTIVRCLLTPKE